ncbi:MAG: bifunctional riboflavin kinase/FAD synthetase [Tissierellia bacterium]|nr:bifunctional riboflavin kinase/FAD synthetase [Tissierellia bacterium]
MEIIDLTCNNYTEDTFVALGNFDGVHLGHTVLIKSVVKHGMATGCKSAVLLFTNHTKNVLTNVEQKILTDMDQKLKILDELGVDVVFQIPFTEDIMKLSPKHFIDNILVKKLNARGVVVGFDYRFGYKASGNDRVLRQICNERGIKAVVIAPIFVNQEVISSTLIRDAIKSGNVEKAGLLLGRPYNIKGIVVRGKQYGRKKGVPTANIKPNTNYIMPLNGVYDSRVIIEGKKYRAATSIGVNPTFNESGIKIEAHILDFNEEIYGRDIELELIEYIRPEIKFETKDELYVQISNDINKIRNGNQ